MFLTRTIHQKNDAVCEVPFYGGLNVLLHVAVVFTRHGRRNVVIFHIFFFLFKSFQRKYLWPNYYNYLLFMYS